MEKLPVDILASQPTFPDDVSPRTSFRRDSDITEVPMTPPMSPTQSEAEEGIIVPEVSQDPFPGTSNHLSTSEPPQWQEAEEMEVEIPAHKSPPRGPLRLLEDEKVHVEKSGLLRLTDFEVKGTLGWYYHNPITADALIVFKVLVPLVAFYSYACEQRPLALKITSH
jgi:hypothetical protein